MLKTEAAGLQSSVVSIVNLLASEYESSVSSTKGTSHLIVILKSYRSTAPIEFENLVTAEKRAVSTVCLLGEAP